MGLVLRVIPLLALLAVAAMQPACSHAPPTTPIHLRANRSAVRAPGEYIVTLAPAVNAGIIPHVFADFGVKRIDRIGRNTFLVVLERDPGPRTIEEFGKKDVRIKWIQPNLIYRMDHGRAQ